MPARSLAVVRQIVAGGAQLPNLIAVLAGSPAVLRGYVRLRAELRHGSLPAATRQRIALAVAERQGDGYGASSLEAPALAPGERAAARAFGSADPAEAALLRFLEALLEGDGPPAAALHEEARDAGWTQEQMLEAIGHVSVGVMTALFARAADLPRDGSPERSRLLQAG